MEPRNRASVYQHRIISFLIVLAVCACTDLAIADGVKPIPGGELSITTKYSRVILRERGSIRVLYFVRDSGEQMVESAMDIDIPHRLLIDYTRRMFASYLFVPAPKKVLIVGLGAGSMVRFLEHHEPEVEIVAIDIDPKMLEIADEYFGTRPSHNVRLVAADGFEFIRAKHERFDVIYMDAFLKPSNETDSTGVPLSMKTANFYRSVQENLTDSGAVVFNINLHEEASEDLEAIKRSFPAVHVFRADGSGNLVVVATKLATPAEPRKLRAVARQAEARIRSPFSLEAWASDLVPGQ